MKTLVEWCWSEAFDKFGFNDGDGLNFTDEVACFIESPSALIKKLQEKFPDH